MAERTGCFGQSDRLRKPKDFKRVSKTGYRGRNQEFVLLVAENPQTGRPRLGITASRRVGNAVARNYLKRSIREWFRGARVDFPAAHDLVVIARQEAASLRGKEVSAALNLAAERALHAMNQASLKSGERG